MDTQPIPPLTDNTHFLMFSFDLDSGRITDTNQLFRQRFKFLSIKGTFEEFLKHLHAQDRDRLLSLLPFSEHKAIQGLILRFFLGEDIRHLKCNFYPIKQGGQVFALIEDITQNVEYNDNLLKHNAKKNAILTILSHDVAGALSTAVNLIDLAQRKAQLGEVQMVQEALTAAKDICKSNISMIRTFLKKEFLATLSVPLNTDRHDIVHSLRNLSDQYKVMQSELGIEVLFRSNKEHIYMETDRDKLIQVFNNLISNALKFTPKGGTVTLCATEKETVIELSVQDNGIGIPDHLKEDIFTKFSLAKREALNGEDSHGIGLWVIKIMVEWLGGNIHFESQENKGTNFLVTFFKGTSKVGDKLT